jgi:hypothetical protein
MPEPGIYEEGGKAFAEEGQVMLDGPDGVAVSMTPDAAEDTGRELLRAAAEARSQLSLRQRDD